MNAIILAAGRGSRMRGLTEERPKCLVDFEGRPLLTWQLEALYSAGIDKIGIVTGYRRELLIEKGLTEFHNPRWSQTNMVASLECAREWLMAEPCVVSYSDIFYSQSAPRALMQSTAQLAVTYDPNWRSLWERRFGDPLLDAETFRLNADGTLAEIGAKPRSIHEIEGQYMGLLRVMPEGWAEIERIRSGMDTGARDKADMTSTLQKVITNGRVPVKAIPYLERWGEIDTSDDLEALSGF